MRAWVRQCARRRRVFRRVESIKSGRREESWMGLSPSPGRVIRWRVRCKACSKWCLPRAPADDWPSLCFNANQPRRASLCFVRTQRRVSCSVETTRNLSHRDMCIFSEKSGRIRRAKTRPYWRRATSQIQSGQSVGWWKRGHERTDRGGEGVIDRRGLLYNRNYPSVRRVGRQGARSVCVRVSRTRG